MGWVMPTGMLGCVGIAPADSGAGEATAREIGWDRSGS